MIIDENLFVEPPLVPLTLQSPCHDHLLFLCSFAVRRCAWGLRSFSPFFYEPLDPSANSFFLLSLRPYRIYSGLPVFSEMWRRWRERGNMLIATQVDWFGHWIPFSSRWTTSCRVLASHRPKTFCTGLRRKKHSSFPACWYTVRPRLGCRAILRKDMYKFKGCMTRHRHETRNVLWFSSSWSDSNAVLDDQPTRGFFTLSSSAFGFGSCGDKRIGRGVRL